MCRGGVNEDEIGVWVECKGMDMRRIMKKCDSWATVLRSVCLPKTGIRV